mmetsp:Transcript_5427/g.8903  ORF Transcript_5427/g.8903 Transcript_5427/m.8903 type:complete len:275 (+) Transcript_5427:725-1549(+)
MRTFSCLFAMDSAMASTSFVTLPSSAWIFVNAFVKWLTDCFVLETRSCAFSKAFRACISSCTACLASLAACFNATCVYRKSSTARVRSATLSKYSVSIPSKSLISCSIVCFILNRSITVIESTVFKPSRSLRASNEERPELGVARDILSRFSTTASSSALIIFACSISCSARFSSSSLFSINSISSTTLFAATPALTAELNADPNESKPLLSSCEVSFSTAADTVATVVTVVRRKKGTAKSSKAFLTRGPADLDTALATFSTFCLKSSALSDRS